MAENAFLTYLDEHYNRVDAAIAGAYSLPLVDTALLGLTPAQAEASEEGLRRYLYRPDNEFSASGGKRVRPTLVLLGTEVMGGDPSSSVLAAAAVEHFQTAALIHDDVADRSATRRGRPCLHVREGEGIAINCGDFALVQSFGSVIEDSAVGASVRMAVLGELYTMMVHTVQGQALDLGWVRDGRWDLTPADYRVMAVEKTAWYSVASPLAIGAILAGASADTVDAFHRFGIATGLAFQIRDDLLNLTGDPAVLGKDLRSDVTEGKRTLVALLALERADEPERRELLSILSAHTSDPAQLSRAVDIMERTGAIAEARAEASRLTAQAMETLDAMDLRPGRALEALRALPDYVIKRSA